MVFMKSSNLIPKGKVMVVPVLVSSLLVCLVSYDSMHFSAGTEISSRFRVDKNARRQNFGQAGDLLDHFFHMFW